MLDEIVKVTVRQGLTKSNEKLNVGVNATLLGVKAVTVIV